ncbi:hypothetical protein [Halomarina pelagica]|nr:hypothetical protein [Halomarina sp. BND7]
MCNAFCEAVTSTALASEGAESVTDIQQMEHTYGVDLSTSSHG